MRFLLFFVILFSCLIGQELYDPYSVHQMNIEFYDSNYDSILEARWYADDKSYLLADITFTVLRLIIARDTTYNIIGGGYVQPDQLSHVLVSSNMSVYIRA